MHQDFAVKLTSIRLCGAKTTPVGFAMLDYLYDAEDTTTRDFLDFSDTCIKPRHLMRLCDKVHMQDCDIAAAITVGLYTPFIPNNLSIELLGTKKQRNNRFEINLGCLDNNETHRGEWQHLVFLGVDLPDHIYPRIVLHHRIDERDARSLTIPRFCMPMEIVAQRPPVRDPKLLESEAKPAR